MRRPGSSVAIIGVVIAALIVLAVGLVLIFGDDGPTEFPEGSPERAMQDFLIAVQDGDPARARSLLSERAQSETDFDFERFVYDRSIYYENRRIRITKTRIEGDDRATLTLWTEFGGQRSIFDFERDGYEQTVLLVREDGQWKIDSPQTIF